MTTRHSFDNPPTPPAGERVPRGLGLTVCLVVQLGLAGVTPVSAEDAPDPIDAKLAQVVEFQAESRTQDRALEGVAEILAGGAATAPQKIRAHLLRAEIFRTQGKHQDALQAAEALVRDMPGDPAAEAAGLLMQSDCLRSLNRLDDAAARGRELLQRQADNAATCAAAGLKVAAILHQQRKYTNAYAEAQMVLGRGIEEPAGAALRLMCDAANAARLPDKTVEACGKLLQHPTFAALTPQQRQEYNRIYGQVLTDLGRHAEASAHGLRLEKDEKDPAVRQGWAFMAGRALALQTQYEPALAAFERVVCDSGENTQNWSAAQRAIVDVLRKQGKPLQALQAARIALDHGQDINGSVSEIADLLRAIDLHVGRANAFINYQRFGPSGPDEKSGTADDLKNPLADIGYPSYPRREEAFAKSRAAAGDSVGAARFRALTFIYTGKPVEALKHYADAFRRAGTSNLQQAGEDLVNIGMRAVQGHTAGLSAFFDYINYGPAGRDGKARTPDDLKDPFQQPEFKPALPPAVPGGQAGLSPGEVQSLGNLVACLRTVAASPAENPGTRRDALQAMNRAYEALGAPPKEEDLLPYWLGLLHDTGDEPGLQHAIVESGLCVAKAGALHMGAMREFCQQLEARVQSSSQPFAIDRNTWQRALQSLTRRFESVAASVRVNPIALTARVASVNVRLLSEEKKPR